jgi:hypothetical protein
MAFPQSVPSLTEEEFEHFRQEVDEFEAPEEMEEDLDKHREALKQDA